MHASFLLPGSKICNSSAFLTPSLMSFLRSEDLLPLCTSLLLLIKVDKLFRFHLVKSTLLLGPAGVVLIVLTRFNGLLNTCCYFAGIIMLHKNSLYKRKRRTRPKKQGKEKKKKRKKKSEKHQF